MKTSLRILLLLVVGFSAAAAASQASREETVFLFENRKVTVAVPPGLAYRADKDARGLIQITLAEPDEKVSLHLTLLPDPEGVYGNARARKEKMVELFQSHVDDSTEKAMQFEELEPRVGAGTYCVFTDARLVGQPKRPPGEYLHSTIGLKAWPGVVAIFELLSQSTTSPQYLAIMKMLRESVEEKPVPLK